MKTLYLDCSMGAAGDMLAAALLELLPDPDLFLKKLNGLGIPGVEFCREKAVKCGICGTHFSVLVDGAEETVGQSAQRPRHRLRDIQAMVSSWEISGRVRKDILGVYDLLAHAESRVHGVPVEQIHFHEVGTLDAVADITAVSLLLDQICPDEVVVSPIHVGSGFVECAHGKVPVPAPATAVLLQGIPMYGGGTLGELCTPTGAALLRYFATRFGDMPVIRTQAVGYGMGKKDFETANCVRAMLGQTQGQSEDIVELSCNVDDMTAEEIAFASQCLQEAGALEVYTVPIGMKKSRAGTWIRVMCHPGQRDEMLQVLFAHTTTLGVREAVMHRYILERRVETVETCYGPVRYKEAFGYGVSRRKYEYEDLARIARERHMTLGQVRERLQDG